MALTESNMMPLGTKAPDFQLTDVISGNEITLSDAKGEVGTVVMFICAHCPYVKNIEEEIGVVVQQYNRLGVGFIGISSNDVEEYPEDAPEGLREQAEENDFEFPYLYDTNQEVAKAYDAACTPEFYLFDDELRLVYRGRFDSSTPGNNEPVTGDELRMALTYLIEEEEIPTEQHPSLGCSIKWKN